MIREDRTNSVAGCLLPNKALRKITSVLLNPKHTGLTAKLLRNQCVYSEKPKVDNFFPTERGLRCLSFPVIKEQPHIQGAADSLSILQTLMILSRVFSYLAILNGSGAK